MLNNNEIDFYNLDIQKYLDWLLNKYSLFSTVKVLPLVTKTKNSYFIREYLTSLHYRVTRNKEMPNNIKEAYTKKIQYFQKQEDEYKLLTYELISFDSVVFEKGNYPKDYGFLSKEELNNVNINTYWLNFYIKDKRGKTLTDFKDTLKSEFQRTPLSEKAFYSKKLQLLKDYDFTFLPIMLNEQFIYNLDDMTNALKFSVEIDHIEKIQYLECLIKGTEPNNEPTKPLKWNANVNILGTIFSELLDSGIIQGTKDNIARMLNCNFIDNNGNHLKKSTFTDTLNPSKNRKSAITSTHLIALIDELKSKNKLK